MRYKKIFNSKKADSSNYKNLNYLLQVDFGDIDGLYDSNINDYFIDINFKESLLRDNKHPKYYVIGRKGTGKSALYNWIERNQVKDEIMVSNKSFNDFPFEKLLSLSDDNFSTPNQYQSIWKFMILTEYANLIYQDQSNPIDDDYIEIKNFLTTAFGDNLSDLYKTVTASSQKTSIGISLAGVFSVNHEEGSDKKFDFNSSISQLNNKLNNIILSYLKRHETKSYIVQFDQLDDNYTAYVDNNNYIQCIISLFKTIYQLNQSFRSAKISIKTVAYLRSDIFSTFNRHDPESSRWEQYVLKLDWTIKNKRGWADSNLLKLINKRLQNSLSDLKVNNPFQIVFDANKLGVGDVFKYIVHRTFQRPRDVIQFCIKIQEECKASKQFSQASILNAEKEYSLWLLGEIENEIAPIIKDTESLYEMLRALGKGTYSFEQFKSNYNRFKDKFPNFDIETMPKLLYKFGIINNVVQNDSGRIIEFFSIIRNDRSMFNRDMPIMTHPGFYQGLCVSRFYSR